MSAAPTTAPGMSTSPPAAPPPPAAAARPPAPQPAAQLIGTATAAAALVWLGFHLGCVSAPVGMAVCWVLVFVALYGVVSWQSDGPAVAKDRLGTVFVYVGAAIAFLPVLAVLVFVLDKGWPVVSADFPHFFTHDLSRAGALDRYTKGGMVHALVGSVEQVGLATIFTAPVGLLTAMYLNESSGPLSRAVSAVVDAMVGVPAIIAGLFVYLLWVLPRHTGGYSGLAAAMALAIVMAPIVTKSADVVLRNVPSSLREAALALGAPRWRVTTQVVLPTARSGLVTAVILGVARAIGETAPVLLTAYGAAATNLNPFHGPQADLPLTVFQLITLPSSNQNNEAWGGALVLILLVIALFAVARIVGSARRGRLRARWTAIGARR